MHRTLTFKSDWHNEWRFDAHENPLSPGSCELAQAIVAELRKRLDLVTDVTQHSFYGWAFRAQFDRAWFHHVLNRIEEAYLTVDYERYWLDWLCMRRANRRFEVYLVMLSDLLKGLPKVSNVHEVLMMTKSRGRNAEQGGRPNQCRR